jgi:hypothetical protein
MYRILAFTFKRGGELSFIEKYLSNLSSPTLRIVGQSQSEDAGNITLILTVEEPDDANIPTI